jgi:hypothetical protein
MPLQATIFGRILMSKPGINYYDIRKQCQGPLCYDFSDADQFLNSAAVKKALGVKEEQDWQECNMLVNAQFYGALLMLCHLKMAGVCLVLECSPMFACRAPGRMRVV